MTNALKHAGAFVLVVLVVPAVATIAVMGVWPGSAKLTAPVFCGDDHPDPYVVVTSSFEGQQDLSLFCVGPRGSRQDVGWLAPSLVVAGTLAAVWLVLLAVGSGLFRLGGRGAQGGTVASGP